MALIVLTGGIGSGKSTVAKLIREKNIPVIDSDEIYSDLIKPGKPLYNKLVKEFGPTIIDENTKQISRADLSKIVFNNQDKLKKLNSLTHPAIYKEIFYQIFFNILFQHKHIVIELPLLYESGYMLKFVKKVIVVRCNRNQQEERIIERNNFTIEEAKKRIDSQMSLEEKCQRADYVIDNSDTPENLKANVDILFEKIEKEKLYIKTRLIFWSTSILIASSYGYLVYKAITKNILK